MAQPGTFGYQYNPAKDGQPATYFRIVLDSVEPERFSYHPMTAEEYRAVFRVPT